MTVISLSMKHFSSSAGSGDWEETLGRDSSSKYKINAIIRNSSLYAPFSTLIGKRDKNRTSARFLWVDSTFLFLAKSLWYDASCIHGTRRMFDSIMPKGEGDDTRISEWGKKTIWSEFVIKKLKLCSIRVMWKLTLSVLFKFDILKFIGMHKMLLVAMLSFRIPDWFNWLLVLSLHKQISIRLSSWFNLCRS